MIASRSVPIFVQALAFHLASPIEPKQTARVYVDVIAFPSGAGCSTQKTRQRTFFAGGSKPIREK
jgi:hypothetical protein